MGDYVSKRGGNLRRQRDFSIQPDRRISVSHPDLGLEIKFLRMAAAMSQRELCAAAHSHLTELVDWELGHKTPMWKTFLRLTDALGIRVRLVFDKEEINDLDLDSELWPYDSEQK